MFFGVGDVYVNLNYKSNMIQHYWDVDTPLVPHDWYKHEAVLTVEALDIKVIVSAQVNPKAPKEIVVSCLLAGLKKISDHWIYDGACARMETQLGFSVDRWISPEIAKVDVVEHDSNGADYRISLIPVIFDILVSEPKMIAHYHEDKQQVELEMQVNDGTHSFRSSVFFDKELWDYSSQECANVGKFKLIQALYESKPEYSHLWSQIRYNWFDMKEISPETVLWYNNIQSGTINVHQHTHKYNPGGYIGPGELQPAKQSVEDSRVKELPALNEMVKHPETGKSTRLRSAIISLNDSYKWTREQIADWLETLDIDISFKVKNDKQD